MSSRNKTKQMSLLPEAGATEVEKTKERARAKSIALMKKVAEKAPVRQKMKRDFTDEELAEIKDGIHQNKIKKEEIRKNNSPEEQTRREKIIKIKKIAREMEKGNNSKIILFPSYSRKSDKLEWYKMGNFSALYYVYRMADRMGRTVKLLKDTDRFAKMDGVASVRDIDKFLEAAIKLNEFDRYEQTVDGFYILYLKKGLTDEEMGILRRTDNERREMMHNVLKPKQADTAVYQGILMLDRQVLPRTSCMERGYFTTIGETMAKDILKITQTYFRYVNNYIGREDAKRELLDLIEELFAGVALLGENEVWGYDVATSIGENINNLKNLIKAMR